MHSEEWRPVVGYEGIYSVSSHGRVRREQSGRGARAGHILKPAPSVGYPSVNLHRDGQQNFHVHRLVAMAFIPNPRNAPEVNHIDGSRSNNRADNLEWVSHAENLAHASASGLMACGESRADSKLTDKRVRIARWVAKQAEKNRHKCYGWSTELAEAWGVSRGTVLKAARRDTWKHVI